MQHCQPERHVIKHFLPHIYTFGFGIIFRRWQHSVVISDIIHINGRRDGAEATSVSGPPGSELFVRYKLNVHRNRFSALSPCCFSNTLTTSAKDCP